MNPALNPTLNASLSNPSRWCCSAVVVIHSLNAFSFLDIWNLAASNTNLVTSLNN